jgi:hypothetical protein
MILGESARTRIHRQLFRTGGDRKIASPILHSNIVLCVMNVESPSKMAPYDLTIIGGIEI